MPGDSSALVLFGLLPLSCGESFRSAPISKASIISIIIRIHLLIIIIISIVLLLFFIIISIIILLLL